MSEAPAIERGPMCEGDPLTCACAFHTTMRRVVTQRRLAPESVIELIDRKTGRPLYRITPDGEFHD